MLTGVLIEINLNGGIIANKGFIRQFSSPGTTIILAKYISAWGGIQSAGQVVGQVVRGTSEV
jgi:MFS transporter, SP family, general alpha glucoside:H+ symporter